MRLSALSVFVLFFCVLRSCFVFFVLGFFLGGARAVLSRARERRRLKAHQEPLRLGCRVRCAPPALEPLILCHWENARRATRQSAPAYKTRPPQARLGGLSGWLAQTRAPGPLGMPQAAFPGLPTKAWLLRAGRRSFESSARQWARGRSKRPGRPLRRKSADVCVEGSNAVGSAGIQGRIGAF